MLNQFSNLSCYEEFEIRCTLTGISKVDVLKIIGHQINDYYFLVSEDGIFNWFDLEGNHVENPCVLKTIKEKYIPKTITKCIIPNSVTSIGSGAFWGCESLKEINISNSVISIGESTFYYCIALKEITIPNSVTSISHKAFVCCESLTSITISDSVTNIGRWAFSHCDSLKEIIFKGKTLKQVKQMENYPFGIEDESIIKCENVI
jgi:hypothetical protein